MTNSTNKYQLLLDEENTCREPDLDISQKRVKNNNGPLFNSNRIASTLGLLPRLLSTNCSPRILITTIAFIAMIYIVTLFGSQNGPKRLTHPQPRKLSSPNALKMVNHEIPSAIANVPQQVDQIKGNNKLWQKLPELVQLNDSVTMELTEHESNLAATFWREWEKFSSNGAERHPGLTYCDKVQMVAPYQIHQNNIYWQVLKVNSNKANPMDIYLYNAYYDNRLVNKPAVKLISTTDRQIAIEKLALGCLLWFDQLKVPILSKVTEIYDVWPEYWGFGVQDGVYGPQILTCAIPKEYSKQVPRAVSIQEFSDCNQIPSTPSNILRVINNRKAPNSKDPSIGVCVQAFRFRTYDVSVRLVEWLEMVRMLGADKVYFYVLGANENIYRVLRHYDKDGLVDWRRLTLPGDQPNVDSLYNFYAYNIGGKFWPQELLELNDCLYRNLFRHDYVAIFDIDEVIMPQTTSDWHQMLEQIKSKLSEIDRQKKAYYLNQHAYVYEMWEERKLVDSQHKIGVEIPGYLYTMRHTYRAKVMTDGSNVKCFHRTDLVTAVHNHFPMRCVNTTGHHTCNGHVIDPSDSILMHYRRNRTPPNNCTGPTPDCAIHDRTAWRYFHSLNEKVTNQLDQLFP